jgi:hypothetical protein
MIKVILRSLIYPWFILFAGFSIGFICNSEWVGTKYVIVERSIRNIFFPLEYNPEIESHIKQIGAMRVWSELECPSEFEVLEDIVKGEEFYWVICQYKDKNGKIIKTIRSTRVKWKTWEYYYKLDEVLGAKKK